MEVSWVPLSMIEARGFLSSYTVAYRGKIDRPLAMFVHKSVFSNLIHVVITGLNAGLTYEVKVWANTSVGAGDASELALAEPVIEGVCMKMRVKHPYSTFMPFRNYREPNNGGYCCWSDICDHCRHCCYTSYWIHSVEVSKYIGPYWNCVKTDCY